MKTLLFFVLFVFVASPAFAQKDTLRMGEALRGSVIRKADAKEMRPRSGNPKSKIDNPKSSTEALEIETRKNEVKK